LSLFGFGFRVVEIDHDRIFIGGVVAVEPHQDESDPIRLELQKLFALDGCEIDRLGIGGARSAASRKRRKNRDEDGHGQCSRRKKWAGLATATSRLIVVKIIRWAGLIIKGAATDYLHCASRSGRIGPEDVRKRALRKARRPEPRAGSTGPGMLATSQGEFA